MSFKQELKLIKLLECEPLPRQLGRRVSNFLSKFSLIKDSNKDGSFSKLFTTLDMASHALSTLVESEYSMATRSMMGKTSRTSSNLDFGTYFSEFAAMERAFRWACIVKKSKYMRHAGRQFFITDFQKL
ncbi:hypothetical protein KL916_004866 [Ogataea parapolymorpha]|nr:hypothetical protein KL916_004866 [Ogataea parapolymorpha]